MGDTRFLDNNIFNDLSDQQIAEALQTYAKVPSIVTLLNGITQVREANRAASLAALETEAKAEQAKVVNATYLDTCANAIEKSGKPKLYHIDGHEHYQVLWQTIDDLAHGEEVKVTKPDGSEVVELRYPKVQKWIIKENYIAPAGKSVSGSKPDKPTARNVHAYKFVNGTRTPVGEYPSRRACGEANAFDAVKNPHGVIRTKASATLDCARAGILFREDDPS